MRSEQQRQRERMAAHEGDGGVMAGRPSPSELIGRLLAVEKLDSRYLTTAEHDRLIVAADSMRATSSSDDKLNAADSSASAGRTQLSSERL